MSVALLILAVFTLAALLVATLELAVGGRITKYLRDIEPLEGGACPTVSIIVAARNEERNISHALTSLLEMDYLNLETIAVDDRSTDRTGAILDEMAQQESRLNVIHISELPSGWLGKNHALWTGAQKATGKYLLFSDADVVMEASAVKRAIAYVLERRLDHLAVAPVAVVKGTLLNMLVGTFFYLFVMGVKPWRARQAKSRKYIGIGAFNLVKADVYESVGTHEAIAMRPDDDMMLGKVIKKNHFRQDVLHGIDMLDVEWYSSIREMVVGLEKNSFAAFNYNPAYVFVSCVIMFVFLVFPVVAIFLTTGVAQLLNILVVALLIVSYGDSAKFHGLKLWHGVGVAPMACVLIFIIARSSIKALINKGIYSRGTHYPLNDLKANRIRF